MRGTAVRWTTAARRAADPISAAPKRAPGRRHGRRPRLHPAFCFFEARRQPATSIFLPRASAALGSVMVSRPFFTSAVTLSSSTRQGRVNAR